MGIPVPSSCWTEKLISKTWSPWKGKSTIRTSNMGCLARNRICMIWMMAEISSCWTRIGSWACSTWMLNWVPVISICRPMWSSRLKPRAISWMESSRSARSKRGLWRLNRFASAIISSCFTDMERRAAVSSRSFPSIIIYKNI